MTKALEGNEAPRVTFDETTVSRNSSDGENEFNSRRERGVSLATLDEQRRLERDVGAIIAWSNAFLSKRSMKASSLTNDFRDGVRLINLLELTYDTQLGSYNARPKLKYHKLVRTLLECVGCIVAYHICLFVG